MALDHHIPRNIPGQSGGEDLAANTTAMSETREFDSNKNNGGESSGSEENLARKHRYLRRLALGAVGITAVTALAVAKLSGGDSSGRVEQPAFSIKPEIVTSQEASPIAPASPPERHWPALNATPPPELITYDPQDNGRKAARDLSRRLTWLANNPESITSETQDQLCINWGTGLDYDKSQELYQLVEAEASIKSEEGPNGQFDINIEWLDGKNGGSTEHGQDLNIYFSGPALLTLTHYSTTMPDLNTPFVSHYRMESLILEKRNVLDEYGNQVETKALKLSEVSPLVRADA